jgi:hypothetical protein
MKKLYVNFLLLVMQLIPPHKCQPVRLFILRCLLDLADVWNAFANWRTEQWRRANMTCQRMALEHYLKYLFGAELSLAVFPEDLILISLLVENQTVSLSLLSEEPLYLLDMPLLVEGEHDWQGHHFVVYAPYGTDTGLLGRTIEQFIFIGISFKIVLIQN